MTIISMKIDTSRAFSTHLPFPKISKTTVPDDDDIFEG